MSKGDETGELSTLAWHMGHVMGALHRPQVLDLLLDRKVEQDDIDLAKKALWKIAQAFYRRD